MKPDFNLFLVKKVKYKFHLNCDTLTLIAELRSKIDTTMGMRYSHRVLTTPKGQKEYFGVVSGMYFEAKRNYIVGDAGTYEPPIIRGELNPVGNKVEVKFTTNRSRESRKTRTAFLFYPTIILVAILFMDGPVKIPKIAIALLLGVIFCYHILARLSQFYAVRRFIKRLSTTIDFHPIRLES